MPELPEVETVKETLKRLIIGKKITKAIVRHNNIIVYPSVEEFLKQIKNQTINDINRRGKWLMIYLDDYVLLSHLRMEGKYFLKETTDNYNKHEHVIFEFSDGTSLHYHDTRKFGKMHLLKKDMLDIKEPLVNLGVEPFSDDLDINYLRIKLHNKTKPIKTLLLDQSIIVGIGNIYVDEILFQSKINPLKLPKDISDNEYQLIIDNTKKVLKKAIKYGGTTIKSYTSSEGVHGKFQQYLQVHGKKGEPCPNCQNFIEKDVVGGRGTYYCPNCQEVNRKQNK